MSLNLISHHVLFAVCVFSICVLLYLQESIYPDFNSIDSLSYRRNCKWTGCKVNILLKKLKNKKKLGETLDFM